MICLLCEFGEGRVRVRSAMRCFILRAGDPVHLRVGSASPPAQLMKLGNPSHFLAKKGERQMPFGCGAGLAKHESSLGLTFLPELT